MRLHFGSQTECLYHLSSYGIPHDFLPLDPNTNRISLKRHLEWVESRFAMEKHGRAMTAMTPKEQAIIAFPIDADVLITGRVNNNGGNERFRAQVKELSHAYDRGTKDERKAMRNMILNTIEECGGRFLKEHKVDGRKVWKEMTKEQSRKIVAQAFRNSYRRR